MATPNQSAAIVVPGPFVMPAEWDRHAATWLAWPHNKSDWPGKYEPIPYVYAEIIRHLSRVEHVHVCVNDEAWERKAKRVLKNANVPLDNVTFHRFPTDRVWTRDSGPIFAKNGADQTVALGWRFNAWAKYDDWRNDVNLPASVAQVFNLPLVQPMWNAPGGETRIVLEGGSIDTNGRGTLLTTEECLLSADVQCRNKSMSRHDLERAFDQYLGIKKTIWLERGIVGDDTHGHIDDIARFVAPDTVVAMVEPNRDDANHEPLRANLEKLRSETTADGKSLNVVEIAMPSPVVFNGQRVPASYANFYVANGLVLVPTFNDANDRAALNTLADVFPDRTIVPIYCGDLIWGLGALHCMTQQQPE